MGRRELTFQEQLELLRSSAFESEHAWLYDASYMQHEAAALALEQQIEQSHASISPDDNTDEQVRIIKTQITIHRERQKALRPHLESGSDQYDEEGNECVFTPAPNQWGANGDLDEESESLSAVGALRSICRHRTHMLLDPKSPYMADLILTSLLETHLRPRRAPVSRYSLPLVTRPLTAHHHIPPSSNTRMDRLVRVQKIYLLGTR